MSSSLCSVFFRHERHTSSRLDTCRAPARVQPAGQASRACPAHPTPRAASTGASSPLQADLKHPSTAFCRIHTEHTSIPSLSPGSPSVTLPHTQAKFKVKWPHWPPQSLTRLSPAQRPCTALLRPRQQSPASPACCPHQDRAQPSLGTDSRATGWGPQARGRTAGFACPEPQGPPWGAHSHAGLAGKAALGARGQAAAGWSSYRALGQRSRHLPDVIHRVHPQGHQCLRDVLAYLGAQLLPGVRLRQHRQGLLVLWAQGHQWAAPAQHWQRGLPGTCGGGRLAQGGLTHLVEHGDEGQ